jgi:predicted TIM-barrel fold metal-dependent hydrolase
MALDGYEVIDLDGHVFEPDSLWDEFLDPQYRSRRPRLRIDDRNTTRYEIDGVLIPPGTGRGAWAPEGVMEATTHRDGGIDPKARLADMDLEGIDEAVLYGAVSLGFYALPDAEYAAALCHAYNDWLASYCAADRERLKGAAVLPMQSMPHALIEARRCVEELGFVSLTVPCCVGLRNPEDPANDEFYALAEELDVPIGYHAGGPRFAHDRFTDNYVQLHVIEFPFDIMFAVTNVLCGGVLERFKRLRIAMLEAGTGWAPFLIHRLDEHYEKRPGEMPKLRMPPSSYLADGRMVISCEAEPDLGHTIDRLGAHVLAYASDYPHWDCEFPDSVTEIVQRDDMSRDDKRLVLAGNARRILYGS